MLLCTQLPDLAFRSDRVLLNLAARLSVVLAAFEAARDSLSKTFFLASRAWNCGGRPSATSSGIEVVENVRRPGTRWSISSMAARSSRVRCSSLT